MSNFYRIVNIGWMWIREWDGSLSLVDASYIQERLLSKEEVLIRYTDGLTHVINKNLFNEMRCGWACNSDLNPAPKQCWSPKL